MRRRWWPALALAVAVVGAGCSSGSSSDTTPSTGVSAPSVPSSVPDVDATPRVDLIAPAIAAVEAQLGGPQDYFEINATSKLVNVWIALNNGTMAQNWVYFDGAATSTSAQPANGHTFAASAVTFDPATVLAQIRRDLPTSSIDLFLVEGGAGGAVRYTAVVTSERGGQLEVVLAPDGTVQQVDTDAVAAATTTTIAG